MTTETATLLPVSMAARGAYWLGILAILVAILSPLGHRFGLFDEKIAIPLFALALLLAVLAILFGVVGIIRAGMDSVPVSGRSKAVIGILIGVVFLGFVALMVAPGFSKPPIHDVTTSPTNPPQFIALAEVHYAGRD